MNRNSILKYLFIIKNNYKQKRIIPNNNCYEREVKLVVKLDFNQSIHSLMHYFINERFL
jgi:hypothetical protein